MGRSGTGRSSGRMVSALGISRVLGLLRDRLILSFEGYGAAADVVTFSLRVAASVQNLVGEQALSAAFIPAYSKRLDDRSPATPEAARRLAGAVFARLLVVAGGLGLVGALAAPWIARAADPELPETIDEMTLAIRFLFPMASLLVMASWCLAVLNSHRRFFLPYLAPALWNLAILSALGLLLVQTSDPTVRQLVLWFSVGALVGGVLQWGVQLPAALRLNGGLRPSLRGDVPGVGETQRRFLPVLLGRGSLQIAVFVEVMLAASLSTGTQSALGSAQRLFFLTLLVCGMVQAIVYLPEFSRAETLSAMQPKVREALHGVWFLVIPSTAGLLLFGYPVVAAVFRAGEFGPGANLLGYAVLSVYVLALLPSASSRVLQSVLYAQGRTKLPAVVAAGRSALALTVAVATMGWWDRFSVSEVAAAAGLGTVDSHLTLAALAFALGSALAAPVELAVLLTRSGIDRRLGLLRRGGTFALVAFGAAAPAAGAWWLLQRLLEPGDLSLFGMELFWIVQGVSILAVFVGSYLTLAAVLKLDEFERLFVEAVRGVPGAER